jgi:chorismate mutase
MNALNVKDYTLVDSETGDIVAVAGYPICCAEEERPPVEPKNELAERLALCWNVARYKTDEDLYEELKLASPFTKIMNEQRETDMKRMLSMIKAQIRNAISDLEEGDYDEALETLNGMVGE